MARRDADMTEGNIWMHMLHFSVPMAIGLLLVDTIVVGQFVGQQAQAAMGSTGPIINMVVGFCAGLATGASVVISQRYGAHDNEGLSKSVHTTVALTFLLSVITTVIGILVITPMLNFMQTPADVMDESRLYLTIYFAGISGILFYNLGSGILRAVGDSRRPLLFLIVSALLNTGLDLLFVLAFGMGVDGVAYATVLSQVLSALMIMVTLTREKGNYGICWRKVRIDRESMRQILPGTKHQHVVHHVCRAELGSPAAETGKGGCTCRDLYEHCINSAPWRACLCAGKTTDGLLFSGTGGC